jgi:hypothetical protein
LAAVTKPEQGVWSTRLLQWLPSEMWKLQDQSKCLHERVLSVLSCCFVDDVLRSEERRSIAFRLLVEKHGTALRRLWSVVWSLWFQPESVAERNGRLPIKNCVTGGYSTVTYQCSECYREFNKQSGPAHAGSLSPKCAISHMWWSALSLGCQCCAARREWILLGMPRTWQC